MTFVSFLSLMFKVRLFDENMEETSSKTRLSKRSKIKKCTLKYTETNMKVTRTKNFSMIEVVLLHVLLHIKGSHMLNVVD